MAYSWVDSGEAFAFGSASSQRLMGTGVPSPPPPPTRFWQVEIRSGGAQQCGDSPGSILFLTLGVDLAGPLADDTR
jgi:hypothetical protein